MTPPCPHLDFVAHADVGRITPEGGGVLPPGEDGRAVPHADDEVLTYVCDLRIACASCGEPFGFRCPDVGVLPDRPAVGVDALELRVPLIPPSELALLGPLAALNSNGLTGFRVTQR